MSFTNYHLGNVLLVSTDRKMGQDPGTDGTYDYYHAVITAYNDYGPFGNILDGRSYSGEAYRYGFNGTEGDQEMYNNSASHDFGARMYNSNLGRFFSVDNYTILYADLSPYCFGGNSPIIAYDPDGNILQIVGTNRYRRKVRRALQKLVKNSSTSRSIIEALISSKNVTYITDSEDSVPFEQFRGIKGNGGDNYRFSVHIADDEEYSELPEGINGELIENSFELYLIHELAHAFSDDAYFGNPTKKELENGGTDCGIHGSICDKDGNKYDYGGSVSVDEVFAVDIENQVRSEMGLKLRHYYGPIEVMDKKLKRVGETSGYQLVDSDAKKDYSAYKNNNYIVPDIDKGWYKIGGGDAWFKAKTKILYSDYFGNLPGVHIDDKEEKNEGQKAKIETYECDD